MVAAFQHLFTPRVTNNFRPRVLHPAGLAMVIGIFILYQTWVRLLMASPLPQGLVLGYASSIDASGVIEATNVERAKVGLAPLQHSPLLSQAAAAKASDMFQDNYWAHIAPDGTTPWNFIRGAGYEYQVAGENLARDFGDTPTMMQAWMDSPTHKENIVNEKYAEIGVAVVNGSLEGVETTLVVQMFGKPTRLVAQTGAQGSTTSVQTTGPQDNAMAAPDLALITATTPSELSPTGTALAQTEPQTFGGTGSDQGITLTAQAQRFPGAVWVSPLTLTKAVAMSVMMMLIGILLYDEYLITKHKIPRRVGKNWAHLTLFGIVLMLIVVISEGKISTTAAQDTHEQPLTCQGTQCERSGK